MRDLHGSPSTKLSGWVPKKYVAPETIYPDGMDYQYLERIQDLTTRGKLLKRFYEWNHTRDGMKPWIAMALDPKEFAAWSKRGGHYIWVVHFQSYYAQIEMNVEGAAGIHRGRLFYRQRNNNVLWLATYQFGPVNFYDLNSIAFEYMGVLHTQAWYMSPDETDKVVPV